MTGFIVLFCFIFPAAERFLPCRNYRITNKAVYIDAHAVPWQRITGFWHMPLDDFPEITAIGFVTKDRFYKLLLPEDDSADDILDAFRERLTLIENPDSVLQCRPLTAPQHLFMSVATVVYTAAVIAMVYFLRHFIFQKYGFYIIMFILFFTLFYGPGILASIIFSKDNPDTPAQKFYYRKCRTACNIAVMLLLMISVVIAIIIDLSRQFPE
ncbi:MAG: hypothetical protein KAR47_11515, partial [Planctomycetes bacterium]|nr:hypothetical protein [Planctomycetota bacterium]